MKNFAARRSFGQHFLKTDFKAWQIAHVHLERAGALPVLEVGAGLGHLTRYLTSARDLEIVELDSRCIPHLLISYGTVARIVHGDFLEVFPEVFDHPEYALIGNFPYNITSQILLKILDHALRVPLFTGMFQLEVARRLISTPGSREYGILSVLLQAQYEGRILLHLSPGDFQPPPAVHSAVILCQRKENFRLPCAAETLRRVTRAAFGQRRKILRNSLGRELPALLPFLARHNLEEKRAEQLSWQIYVELALELEEEG